MMRGNFEHMTLAEKLSDILHHPELPEPLYEAIMEGLADLFNQHVDQSAIIEWERSPRYLQMLLNGFDAKRGIAGDAPSEWPERIGEEVDDA